MNSQIHTRLLADDLSSRIRHAEQARVARELRRTRRAARPPVSQRPRLFGRLVPRLHRS